MTRPIRHLDRPWGRLAYRLRDGCEPPLVLVHGSCCDGTDWAPVLPHLAAGRMTVSLDLCGHGESDGPGGPVTFDGMARDILALADTLSLDRPVLGGHSLGGMLALRCMELAPTALRGAVLVEGWTRLGVPWTAARSMYGTLPRETVAAIRQRDIRTLARWPGTSHEEFWRTVRRADGTVTLATSDIPVLEIYGDRGESHPPGAALLVPERPNITLVWIEGAAHYLLHEAPERVGRAMADWLSASAIIA